MSSAAVPAAGCWGRIRTCDLKGMNLASFLCSTQPKSAAPKGGNFEKECNKSKQEKLFTNVQYI